MAKDVIIALDFPDRERTLGFLDRFGGERPWVKIGMELFYAAGPGIVREIKERGHKIFLDLKLCDIPNTVKGAMRSLSSLGVDIINLHAFGTGGMMRAALEAGEVHERCGADFLTVTPGVRFSGGERGDQVRVTTPARARELGSDYIVVGRPITGAEDPVAAWRRARAEFLGGDACGKV